jgi:hypothetical protein
MHEGRIGTGVDQRALRFDEAAARMPDGEIRLAGKPLLGVVFVVVQEQVELETDRKTGLGGRGGLSQRSEQRADIGCLIPRRDADGNDHLPNSSIHSAARLAPLP